MRPLSRNAVPLRAAALGFLAVLAAANGLAAETYVTGSSDDPKVRVATFLDEEKRYYSALTELLGIPGIDAGVANAELREQLRQAYLSFGMRERAAGIDEGSGDYRNPRARVMAALALGRFEYQRGYVEEARKTLLRAEANVPRDLKAGWADLLARVLIAQARYREAADVLDDVDVRQDPQGFLRYNLGIALMRDGRTSDACAVLDRVGRLEGSDRVTSTLRDRANVTLGWHFLQQNLGGAARPLLMRVSSSGPYSSRALLGLGWAELEPAGREMARADLGIKPTTSGRLRSDPGDPLTSLSPLGVLMRNVPLDDPSERRGKIPLLADPEKAEDDAMRRALLAWNLIVDGEGDDPAVHEAWLAVPFVLDKLGAHSQAAERYQLAVQRLDDANERLARARSALRSGRLVETLADTLTEEEAGWNWSVQRLPDIPETNFLRELIADHPFNEALKNYRDIRLIERQLSEREEQLDHMMMAFDATTPRPIDPMALIERARRGRPFPYRGEALWLIEARTLDVPAPSRPGPSLKDAPLSSLRLSSMPGGFSGVPERLQGLRQRLKALKPIVERIRAESADRLRRLASDELSTRAAQLDRYRVEAHFALARLYDNTVPIPDQDEFELLDGASRPYRLERDEYEIERSIRPR